jgi:hypothetical protein
MMLKTRRDVPHLEESNCVHNELHDLGCNAVDCHQSPWVGTVNNDIFLVQDSSIRVLIQFQPMQFNKYICDPVGKAVEFLQIVLDLGDEAIGLVISSGDDLREGWRRG